MRKDGDVWRRPQGLQAPLIYAKGGKFLEEFMTSTLQTGFSIAVAAYLLIRMERRLDELAIAINNLEKGVAKYFGEV
jgi:hypothetical protein